MKAFRRRVTIVYITKVSALLLGEGVMADPTYTPIPVPNYKQTPHS
jgi:hypothetical protein